MSVIRNFFSSCRKARREEHALPYPRSGRPSANKEKNEQPDKDSFGWQFFDYFSFVSSFRVPLHRVDVDKSDDDEVEDCIVVCEEQDVEMTDDTSVPTTEESTTDTSVESVETVEPVEPAKPSEPTEPAMPAQSSNSVPPAESAPSDPTILPASTQPAPSASNPSPSTSTALPLATSDEELLEWAMRKKESQSPMTYAEFLGLQMFFESRRGDREYEPIKLRFSPHEPSHPATSRSDEPSAVDSSRQQPGVHGSVPIIDSFDSTSHQPGSSDFNAEPSDVDNTPVPHWKVTGCYSGFSGTASLPPFKNNVPRRVNKSKLLSKDPNGPINWRGAGSVRRAPEEVRKRPASAENPRPDPVKRRKLFEEMNGCAAAPDVAISQGASESSANGAATPRSGMSRQHSAPHVPSPLRNVITSSPPSPPPRQARPTGTNLSATTSGTSTKRTASAAFLEKVIEEATPRPKQPDVANPYQAAAPVKLKVKPMEKKRMSERRARTREAEKQKEEQRKREAEKKELSAKEIIEATVPKGAKRSRPPPGLGKTKAANTAASKPSSNYTVEEPQEESAPKKKRRTVTVEEVTDEEDGARNRLFPVKPTSIIEQREPEATPTPTRAPITRPAPASANVPPSVVPAAKSSSREAPTTKAPPREVLPAKVSSTKESNPKVASTKELSAKTFVPKIPLHGTGKSSRPKEPSKLRTSFLPDDEGENEVPKTSSPQPIPTVTMTTPGQPLAEVQEKKDPKEVALTLPLNDLPTFVFKTPPAPVAIDHTDARVAAKELPVTSLPKFDFSKARSSMNGLGFPAVPIPTLKAFDFAAAGVRPRIPGTDGEWQCTLCVLSNPASATEKCQVCETPRPGAEKPKASVNSANTANGITSVNGKTPSPKPSSTLAPPVVKAFDFAAAGFKPKEAAEGQWECLACNLQNSASAREKCAVCDTPRPGVEKAAKAEKVEKPAKADVPAKTEKSTKAEKAEKSEKTEKTEKTKKPYMNGTSHSSKPLTNGTSVPPVKGFDFAAAGLKPSAPINDGSWYCKVCMLQNPATATEKCKVCDSPRPGVEKKKRAAKSPTPIAMPIPPVMPRSLDWTAAGLAPRLMDHGSSRTCGSCSLHAPPAETESCKICDASRS